MVKKAKLKKLEQLEEYNYRHISLFKSPTRKQVRERDRRSTEKAKARLDAEIRERKAISSAQAGENSTEKSSLGVSNATVEPLIDGRAEETLPILTAEKSRAEPDCNRYNWDDGHGQLVDSAVSTYDFGWGNDPMNTHNPEQITENIPEI